MRDLLNALLGTDCFSASHAPPESKNGKLRTMLQKIAASSEIEFVECAHYRDMAAKQLEDLFTSVFMALDEVDLALAPTFILKIHCEDSLPIPCHAEEAQEAAKDYTAEGKTSQARKGALAKDNLAWLKAMFTSRGVELSQKQLLGKLPKVVINDNEVREALAQCINPATPA